MSDLRGISWSHTRGFGPLAVLGRVWEDRNPGSRVTWDARSLKSFGEESLDAFADDYDLIVFDYPFAGEALAKGWLAPLDTVLPPNLLDERRRGTVGPLYDAFVADGHPMAIPIDVATHVSAARIDLLDGLGVPLPDDWDATCALARATGKVAMPMRAHGLWGAFLTMCANSGDAPFRSRDDAPFAHDVARVAVERLRELATLIDPSCLEAYPVPILNAMADGDAIAFVPLTYGYCTYGLAGYARRRLSFDNIRLGGPDSRGAILGGAGIGVSARRPHIAEAAAHAAWLTSPEVQSRLYVTSGGQPAQRAAWTDAAADAAVNGFFSNTLASAEAAFVRPNHRGFRAFQNRAADLLHECVTGGAPVAATLSTIEAWWLSGTNEA